MTFIDKDTPLQVIVLNNKEEKIGYLNPDYVEIDEDNKANELRTIRITHPLTDKTKKRGDNYYLNLLSGGNKIYQVSNTDGKEMLYVLHEEREINPKDKTISIGGTEVAVELSEVPPRRFNYFSPTTINRDWLVSLVNTWFTVSDNILTGCSLKFSGVDSPMALLRLIEQQNTVEFEFEYKSEYDPITKKDIFRRYLSLKKEIGKQHERAIELGLNSDEIEWTIDDTDTRIAVAPLGAVDSSDVEARNKFHSVRAKWEALSITKGQNIKFGVSTDNDGNETFTGMANAPYAKQAGRNYVEIDNLSEISAVYTRFSNKEGSSITTPRVGYFDSSEENEYNIYWLCVENGREHLTSEISISAKMVDIFGLKGHEKTYYNVGDKVYIRLQEYDITFNGRITETSKNYRERGKDTIKIGTPTKDFLDTFLKQLKS